jgi:hypothetical protein
MGNFSLQKVAGWEKSPGLPMGEWALAMPLLCP